MSKEKHKAVQHITGISDITSMCVLELVELFLVLMILFCAGFLYSKPIGLQMVARVNFFSNMRKICRFMFETIQAAHDEPHIDTAFPLTG